MNPKREDYDAYVPHPRYGKRPQITGLNPTGEPLKVHFHWHSSRKCRFPDTAIKASMRNQHWRPNTYGNPVTHYFDVKRVCRDCKKPFIFFAEEQKHWYEYLQFPLEVDCVRCPPCRKQAQGIARLRERYADFCESKSLSVPELIEFASCCLDLIARGAITAKQFQRARTLLNRVPKSDQTDPEYVRVRSRLLALEEKIART